MATNLFEEVNQMMGTPVTRKEQPARVKPEHEKTLYGAAIPAALAGVYHLAASAQGSQRILNHLVNERQVIENPSNQGCVEFTFGNNAEDVVKKVADYSGEPYSEAYSAVNEATSYTYRLLIKVLVTEKLKAEDITKYMVAQRHNILSQLPEALHLGHLLGDETLDDVSNKMDGPISTLIHKLGDSFSSSAR
jgi:hypothetical protein